MPVSLPVNDTYRIEHLCGQYWGWRFVAEEDRGDIIERFPSWEKDLGGSRAQARLGREIRRAALAGLYSEFLRAADAHSIPFVPMAIGMSWLTALWPTVSRRGTVTFVLMWSSLAFLTDLVLRSVFPKLRTVAGPSISVVILVVMSGVMSGLFYIDEGYYPTSFWVPGVLFAHAMIAGNFARHEKARLRLRKLVILAGASVFANFTAARCGYGLLSSLELSREEPMIVRVVIETAVGAAAGFVGGAALGIGVVAALGLQRIFRIMLSVAGAGAVLGAPFLLSSHLGLSSLWQGYLASALFYAFWQGGVAWVILWESHMAVRHYPAE